MTDVTVWAGLLGLQQSRFDILKVWDPVTEAGGYIDVALALEDLREQIGPIAADEDRISALEAKVTSLEDKIQSLGDNKADKFVALDPLSLDTGVFPNELFQSSPTPASASAINLNGETAYIQFDGRTDVLDYTKDWSVGCSIQTQNMGVEGSNMTAFSSGGVSLNLKVQGAPSISSNWGSYNSSNGDLYSTTGRFNANVWSSPIDACRLLWRYDSNEKKLAYYISYEDGSYSRKANITVPQSAIDAQTPGPELAFSKPWSGQGGAAFSGSCYEGVLSHWILSPHAWTEEELVKYFASAIEDLPTLALYDKVSSYIVPGVYPNLTDLKGTLSNGQLIGGEEADFLV